MAYFVSGSWPAYIQLGLVAMETYLTL